MFSSQQRHKTPWTPKTLQTKPKSVVPYDAPSLPPPTTSISASESGGVYVGGNIDDWKRFKEVGLLDTSSLEKKDYEALLHKISRLQNELSDYQYNMGLLIIEKQDLVSKTEELSQEFFEAQEILKRERVGHLIAVSEAEKRQENLKKAINAERNSLLDIEKAMRDLHEEHSKAKSTCETSVTDLNARLEELHKQSLDVGKRSCSIDLKLEELDRKNFELDRKLQDLEDRENILESEQLLLTQERQSHELYSRKQKNDILEWEKKLQDGEKKLCENRRLLNEREEKLNDIVTSTNEKESHVEDLQKKIDLANEISKKVENEVKNQLEDLDMKEKNTEAMRRKLEEREKELLEDEQKLDIREKVELEKILNEQKIMLDAKMRSFELDMEHKRRDLEEELRNRKETIDQTETKVKHLEVKLSKREEALKKKTERLNEKEKEFDVKSKAFKEQEKFLKSNVKRLDVEKKQVNVDKESLENIKKEIEMLRNSMKEQEVEIREEVRNLEDVERERSEYVRFRSSLKEEIESERRQSELLEKEACDLKFQREKFKKDWEALEGKRKVVENEVKILAENKTIFEKLRTEVERLKKERDEFEERLFLELENIRLEKESFEETMQLEKVSLDEEGKRKLALMCKEFEGKKKDLINDMEKRREDWRNLVEEKEKDFEERKSREMRNLKWLKDKEEKKRDEMEIERNRLEKERKEMESNYKQLEESRSEITKDVKVLENLSEKLKKQREELVRERENFGALIRKIKCCQNCGKSAQEFLLNDFQLPILEGTSRFPKDELNFARDYKEEKVFQFSEVERDLPTLRGKTGVLQKRGSKNGGQHTNNHITEDFAKAGPTSKSEIDDLITDSEVEAIKESEKPDEKVGPSKRRPKRTHSVKEVVKEAKSFLREDSLGKLEEEPSDFAVENLKNEDKNVRAISGSKRSYSQSSKVSESVEYSEGNGDSVTTGGRKKRRQNIGYGLPTPGQKRYNLRRHTVGASSGKAEPKNDVNDKKQVVQKHDETPTQALDVAVESGGKLHLGQVSTTRSIEFTSERRDTTNVADSHGDTPKSVENEITRQVKTVEPVALVSEINEVSEDTRSMVNENDDDDDDDVDDDDDNGDDDIGMSIGKKLWKFFST